MNLKLEPNLKALMQRKGYGITQLAKATNIPKSTINNWLSGQEPRSISQVKELANFFEVSLDELCFSREKERSPIDDLKDSIYAGSFDVILVKKRDRKL